MMRAAAQTVAAFGGSEGPRLLGRFRALIAERLGLLIDSSQEDRLRDSLTRLSAADSPERYLDRLEREATQTDLDALAAALTVGETYFFRHPEQFDALRTQFLPAWVRQHPGQRLRALSAGCATGEEAYTLAITLQRSCLSAAGVGWDIQAFDLNTAAIRTARAARYGEWSLRATPKAWRELWFREDDTGGWVLNAGLRRQVRFDQRQIAQPDALFWAPERFDVIFCRNMLMYLDGPSLRRAVRHLTTALAPGGLLFLGHAETLHGLADGMALRQADGCFFYQRRQGGSDATAGWPFAGPARHTAEPVSSASAPPLPTAAESPAPRLAPDEPPAFSDTSAADTLHNYHLEAAQPLHDPAHSPLDEALLLVEAGQLDDGLRACARLMDAPAPAARQADVLFVQALALEERGELSAAEWHLQRAAAKDADFAMPHLRLGLMARRRGEPVAARRELHRALELIDGETPDRMRRFGGGFDRDALRQLCLVHGGPAR